MAHTAPDVATFPDDNKLISMHIAARADHRSGIEGTGTHTEMTAVGNAPGGYTDCVSLLAIVRIMARAQIQCQYQPDTTSFHHLQFSVICHLASGIQQFPPYSGSCHHIQGQQHTIEGWMRQHVDTQVAYHNHNLQ